MSNSILFLAAALGSSLVLGLLVVFLSRPRRVRNSYGQFSSQLHALSQATQRAPDRRYESRGVTLLESASDSEANQQGRSASGS
jgi:hypothetical protein